jgi:hypothetical protein
MRDGEELGVLVSDETDRGRRYPSREGKRAATVYLDLTMYRSLRVIAALEDKSLQDVLVEAAALLLATKAAEKKAEEEKDGHRATG